MGDTLSQQHQDYLAAAGGAGVLPAGLQNTAAIAAAAAASQHAANGAGSAGATPVAGGVGGGGVGGVGGWPNNELCEPALLSQLVQLLGQRSRHSLLLSDLGALLPQPLRHGVKEKGGLRSWLQKYPELFLVSGQPGKESVTLLIGAGADAAASGGAGQGGGAGAGEASEAAKARAEQAKREEDEENDAALQLRGLPYRATVSDIRRFLGRHAQHLKNESSVQLVLNRDGRPSGFARVQFNSADVAAAARAELHMNRMEIAGQTQASGGQGHASTDRYVEVFLYSERPNKLRFKRTAGDGEGGVVEGDADDDLSSLGITKEEVIQQCREHMQAPGQDKLLLSMLGVALSQSARLYLKKTDQGLKHFLSQYPNEFSVDGAKGREMITYLPAGGAGGALAAPAGSDVTMPWKSFDFAGAGGRNPTSAEHHAASPQAMSKRSAQRRTPDESRGALSAGGMPQKHYGLATPNCFDDDAVIPKSPNPIYHPTPDGFGGTPRGLAAHGQQTPSDWGTPQPFGAHWGGSGDPNKHLGRGADGQAHSQVESGSASHGADPNAVAIDANALGAAMFNNWSAWAMPPATYWPPPTVGLGPWAGACGTAGLIDTSALIGTTPPPLADSAAFAHMAATGPSQSQVVAVQDFLAALGGCGGIPTGVTPLAVVTAAASAAPPATPQPQQTPAAASSSTPTAEQLSNSGPPCAVRLRGLPFTATEQDVLAFFAKHDVVEHIAEARDAVKMIPKATGKPSGQAIVQMLSRADAMEVVGVLNGQYMGARYIEVFHHTETADAKPISAAQQPPGASAIAAAAAAAVAAAAGRRSAASPTQEGAGTGNEAGDTGGSGSSGALAAGTAAQHSAAGMHMWPNAAAAAAANASMGQDSFGRGGDGEVAESAWEALFGFLKRGEVLDQPGAPGAVAAAGGAGGGPSPSPAGETA